MQGRQSLGQGGLSGTVQPSQFRILLPNEEWEPENLVLLQ